MKTKKPKRRPATWAGAFDCKPYAVEFLERVNAEAAYVADVMQYHPSEGHDADVAMSVKYSRLCALKRALQVYLGKGVD